MLNNCKISKKNKVFILGAGSSRDLRFNTTNIDYATISRSTEKIEAKFPLSKGYFYDFNEFSKVSKQKMPLCFPPELCNNLKEYINRSYDIKDNDLSEDKEASGKVNIEELYLRIKKVDNECRIPRYETSLLEYITETMSFICLCCISENHSTIAKYIIKEGIDVISFNWDILFDEAMIRNGWDYKKGYLINFKDFLFKGDKIKNGEHKNLLLKPHGSINWYADTNNSYDRYLIFPPYEIRGTTNIGSGLSHYELSNNKLSERNITYGNDIFFKNNILPPGQKEENKDIWLKIKEILERVDEVIVIGFSFNPHDWEVEEEFNNGISFKKGISIKIVNPEKDKNLDELIETYKKIFKTNDVTKIADTLDSFCKQIQDIQ